jgi:hypothetical protein
MLTMKVPKANTEGLDAARLEGARRLMRETFPEADGETIERLAVDHLADLARRGIEGMDPKGAEQPARSDDEMPAHLLSAAERRGRIEAAKAVLRSRFTETELRLHLGRRTLDELAESEVLHGEGD